MRVTKRDTCSMFAGTLTHNLTNIAGGRGKISAIDCEIDTASGRIRTDDRRLRGNSPIQVIGLELPPDDNIQGLKCIGNGYGGYGSGRA